MKNRKIVWFAIAVLALLFCGFGTGMIPGGMGLLPLKQIFAMFEVYNIYFPMAAVTGVYAPYGQNTAYLPIRVGADWDNPPASVDFSLDSETVPFWTDDTFPFSGFRLNIQDDTLDVHTIYADARDALDAVVNTESGDIDLKLLTDADGNGIPDAGGINDPFEVPTPATVDHTVYVGQVGTATFFSAVASVIPPPTDNTPELTYVMAGSPTGDFQDVLLEVDDRVVLPDTDARLILRAAASPGDIDAALGLLPIPAEGIGPPLVGYMAAIDVHLVADVDGTTMAIEDLDPYPMTARVVFPVLTPNTPELMAKVGMPIFYADTSLDADFNPVVDTTTFAQLAVPQVIENTAELVFQIDGLTAYVPMLHLGAPVLDPTDPDAVAPASGPSAGCTPVSIVASGSLDETGLIVEFGGSPATNVNVILNTVELSGPHLITCETPDGDVLGSVDVFITNPDVGGWPIFAMLEDAYDYTDSTPQITGVVPDIGSPGTAFTISGSEFDPDDVVVDFGGLTITVTVTNCTAIDGNVPGLPPGIYDITVTDSLSGNYDYISFEVLPGAPTRGGAGGPCFIATAAYGTPMARELDALRTLRDRYLLTNAAGTALMKAYYKHSPAVAKAVADNAALRAITRAMLTALVTPLWVKIVAFVTMAAGAVAIIRKKVTA